MISEAVSNTRMSVSSDFQTLRSWLAALHFFNPFLGGIRTARIFLLFDMGGWTSGEASASCFVYYLKTTWIIDSAAPCKLYLISEFQRLAFLSILTIQGKSDVNLIHTRCIGAVTPVFSLIGCCEVPNNKTPFTGVCQVSFSIKITNRFRKTVGRAV